MKMSCIFRTQPYLQAWGILRKQLVSINTAPLTETSFPYIFHQKDLVVLRRFTQYVVLYLRKSASAKFNHW